MARCQACQGLGWIEMVAHLSPYSAVIYREPVCRACGGWGWEQCCEGLREQQPACDRANRGDLATSALSGKVGK